MNTWKCFVVLREGDEFVGVWPTLKETVDWLKTTDISPDDIDIQCHDAAGSYFLDPDQYIDEVVSWKDIIEEEP